MAAATLRICDQAWSRVAASGAGPAQRRVDVDRERPTREVVSELAGHASIAITLDRYGYLFPAALDGAAGAFAAYLERADSRRRLAQLD
jgi:hypothetical protein